MSNHHRRKSSVQDVLKIVEVLNSIEEEEQKTIETPVVQTPAAPVENRNFTLKEKIAAVVSSVIGIVILIREIISFV